MSSATPSSGTADVEARLLYLVPKATPLLHTPSATVEFPLSHEDRCLIASMRNSIQPASLAAAKAPWPSGVGMAAPQWGVPKRIFLYCPTRDVENPTSLQVMINPSYVGIGEARASAWEGCFSVPGQRGLVERFTSIEATWQTEEGETITRRLDDWPARVFQHECDHTEGRLYDNEQAALCKEILDTTVEQLEKAREQERANSKPQTSVASNQQ